LNGVRPRRQHQTKKHRERHAQDDVGVTGAELVGEAVRALFVLRVLMRGDDFCSELSAARFGDENFTATPKMMVPARVESPTFFPTGVASPAG